MNRDTVIALPTWLALLGSLDETEPQARDQLLAQVEATDERDDVEIEDAYTLQEAMMIARAVADGDVELPPQWDLEDLVLYVEDSTDKAILWNDMEGTWEAEHLTAQTVTHG